MVVSCLPLYFFCDDPEHTAIFQNKIGDTLAEMHFAAVLLDGGADVLYHAGQFVGTDMRVRLREYVGFCAVFHQEFQGFAHVAAFDGTGV